MNRTTLSIRRSLTGAALAAGVLLAPVALAGCSSAAPEAGTAQSASAMADSATLERPWAKAAEGMTAAFGTLVNASDAEITLVGASSPAAKSVEIHEMFDGPDGMVMQELEGGLTVPAKGSHELAPGGEHLMLMGLVAPLTPGEEITITLTFSDDSTQEITVPVKDFSGANETYGDDEHAGHGESDEHAEHADADEHATHAG